MQSTPPGGTIKFSFITPDVTEGIDRPCQEIGINRMEMKMSTPNELIKKYFDYLTADFGFQIIRDIYDSKSFGNAQIIYASKVVGIEVISDRGSIYLSIGRITQPVSQWFAISDIIQYFAPEIENPYLAKVYQKGSEESRIKWLSQVLLQYCKIILTGDLSMEDELNTIKDKRIIEAEKRFKYLKQKSIDEIPIRENRTIKMIKKLKQYLRPK